MMKPANMTPPANVGKPPDQTPPPNGSGAPAASGKCEAGDARATPAHMEALRKENTGDGGPSTGFAG
jgi:hypothetical protein